MTPAVRNVVLLGGGRRAPAWVLAGAALDLDLANNLLYGATNFTDVLTCSRASTGYAQTAAGLLTSFGTNVLRRSDLGLLIEEARTNLILQSQTLDNAAWNSTALTVAADAAVAPDGTTTAESFTASATTSLTQRYQQFTAGAATYTWSIYFQKLTTTWAWMSAIGGDGVTRETYINLATGALGTNAAGTTAVITALANGWYRLELSRAAQAGVSAFFTFGPCDADGSRAVTAGKSLYAWGAQLELGTFATSYIPTTSASVTRAADVVTGGVSWFQQGGPGSIVVSAQINGIVTDGNYNSFYGIEKSGSGTTEFVMQAVSDNTTVQYLAKHSALVLPISRTVSAIAGRTIKAGFAFSSGDSAASADGGAVGTSATTGAIPNAADTFKLGLSSYGTDYLNGYMKRFTYWNSRLPNATLQSLTT